MWAYASDRGRQMNIKLNAEQERALKQYEQLTGVSVQAAANEAINNYIECDIISAVESLAEGAKSA